MISASIHFQIIGKNMSKFTIKFSVYLTHCTILSATLIN